MVWLVTRFIEHLYTQIVTTSNYRAMVNFHTLQISKAHTKFSQSAFTSRSLVTDFNIEASTASVL
jgi:hypothetical protein